MSKPPIVVALSGGVDSATAAAVLVAQGHQVVGITMRLYDASGTTAAVGRCCGPRDIEDARRVASHLGIPFYVVDFEADFATTVVEDFVDAYLAGETPNPCVKCNQYIKFTPLLRRARALGAEVLATGHYARIEQADGQWCLRRGVDLAKDQSYFLFSMPATELGAVRFPLGGMSKDDVRARAAELGLPNAAKPESQEICFVPDGDYAGFVSAAALSRGRQVPPPGQIVDPDGKVLGEHRGIHHYTVGQRRGFGGVSADGKPVYVLRIEPATNRIVVGARSRAGRTELVVRDVQWFIEPPSDGISASVQTRHGGKSASAQVHARGPGAVVSFEGDPVVAAPGQAAVFYDRDRVLGGGWISSD